jgi:hypothetical protein
MVRYCNVKNYCALIHALLYCTVLFVIYTALEGTGCYVPLLLAPAVGFWMHPWAAIFGLLVQICRLSVL